MKVIAMIVSLLCIGFFLLELFRAWGMADLAIFVGGVGVLLRAVLEATVLSEATDDE